MKGRLRCGKAVRIQPLRGVVVVGAVRTENECGMDTPGADRDVIIMSMGDAASGASFCDPKRLPACSLQLGNVRCPESRGTNSFAQSILRTRSELRAAMHSHERFVSHTMTSPQGSLAEWFKAPASGAST